VRLIHRALVLCRELCFHYAALLVSGELGGDTGGVGYLCGSLNTFRVKVKGSKHAAWGCACQGKIGWAYRSVDRCHSAPGRFRMINRHLVKDIRLAGLVRLNLVKDIGWH
jgi:hypothetical protein